MGGTPAVLVFSGGGDAVQLGELATGSAARCRWMRVCTSSPVTGCSAGRWTASATNRVCDRVAVIQHGRLVKAGPIDELRRGRGLLIRAHPVEAAHRLMVGLFGAEAVTAVDGTVRLGDPAADPAEVNQHLVAAGVAVSELRPLEQTLEQTFLQLTAGSKDAS